MEILKGLITRIRHTGVLLLIGIIAIAYISFGFLYWQQGGQQKEYEAQIAKLSAVLSRPLPNVDKLHADYDNVTARLAPMTDIDAIDMLVGIAQENGIDVSQTGGKFSVPKASFMAVSIEGVSYRVLSFNGIRVQGNYDNVTAFISDLDSGKTLETMVLTELTTNKVNVTFTGEEGGRRAEFRSVADAVAAMMDDIGLTSIPNPLSFANGVASNLMGDNPDTEGTVEGFPDITATPAERGYSGDDTPRNGYVLYEHDRISTDNTSQFKTVSYFKGLATSYYYTCESDGRVRQFDRADVASATEYLGNASYKEELMATMNVNIYTKP